MQLLKKMLITIATLSFAACTDDANVSTFWVNSIKRECAGVGKMQCLMVQKGDKIDPLAWENFHAPIEGFEYRPGNLYKIKVEEEQLDIQDVPADASSIKYTLIKVLEEKADPKLRLNDIWVLKSLSGENVASAKEGERRKDASMEINLSQMRVMGNDGCNSYNGAIELVGQEALKFGVLAGTRMMCVDMALPDAFNKALSKVEKYEIKDLSLFLYDKDEKELMVLKKVD